MDYEYLEHTADAKFRAYGKTIEEAFINSAKAAFGILIECNKVNPKIEKKITLSAKKTESLLYDFIEELLFMLDVDGFLLSDIKDLSIKDNTLICTAYGDNYKNYEISGNIKSVTYNDMEIKKTDDGYEITMVVDL